MPALHLRPLAPDDETEASLAHEELAGEGFEFLRDRVPGEPWADYLGRVAGWRRGVGLPEGFVPMTVLVGEAGGRLVGRVGIRPSDGGEVLTRIGHVGYGVRPADRRRGYASEMLQQALVVARAHGVERVLVTCDADNLASAAVIERGGGVEDVPHVDVRGTKRRFWIAPGPGELWLRPLRDDDERVALAAHDELAGDDFSFLLDRDRVHTWAEYVALMARWQRGDDLPADRVRAAYLVAQVGDDVVGRVSVRYELDEYLRREGGHIGYGVRPQFRRRGHAAEILRQALVLTRAEGVPRALATCDDDNVASARVIEGAGGVEEPGEGGVRRFWIA
jgi:predicted acetyltransferase